MCRRPMFYRNRLSFRDVHLFSENLCQPIDQHGLTSCLFMKTFYRFWHKGLSHFFGVLSKQFMHLLKRKVRQMELVLNIKRQGDGPVVVELNDVLDSHNTDAMRTSRFTGKIDMP